MIFWRGKGIWTLFIFVGCTYVIPWVWHMLQGQTSAQAADPRQYGLPFIVSLLTAGAILIAWGLFLNRRPARRVIEPETGRSYMARPSHSLYHLNMEYWGVAALLGGVWMLVKPR